MNEIWKDIEGYDGAYQVSNMGRVKSVARVTTRLCQYGIREYRIPERIMRTRFGTSGYLCVNLHHEGKQVTEMIHRLVALHFCKGYADGMTVNHIDEVKTNNRADNLEWCDRQYNINYGTGKWRREKFNARPVEQLTMDGKHIAYHDNVSQAARAVGCDPSTIRAVCNGKHGAKNCQTAKGYRWRYKEETDN
jgi:hypothetical protein